MTITQDRFFKLVDDAVALNVESQILNLNNKPHMTKYHWMVEFGTVHLNVGRRVGKTTYIQSRVTPVDLIIVHNEYTRRQYFDDMSSVFMPNVVTANQVMNQCTRLGYPSYLDPTHYNKVYIDEPGLMEDFRVSRSKGILQEWYSNKCNQIIMLGTAVI